VIKKDVGNSLYFGVENRGFFLAPEMIIYEAFLISRARNAWRCLQLGASAGAAAR